MLKSRPTSAADPLKDDPRPLFGACHCLVDFYREEFRKHHECLLRQREYYSELAVNQAEEALTRILAQLEELCQRDDAGKLVGELLKKFDMVTKLSAWTEPHQLN